MVEGLLTDQSLITGRGGGGLQNGRGAWEVVPLQKGGAGKVVAMLKRGHKQVLGYFLRCSLKL